MPDEYICNHYGEECHDDAGNRCRLSMPHVPNYCLEAKMCIATGKIVQSVKVKSEVNDVS